MANNVVFFAVHADDLARARKFYDRVFQWKFEPWGPPDFFLVKTEGKDGQAIDGAMHKRHEVVPGEKMRGFECTIAVEDIDATAKAVLANGGEIIHPKFEIPTVGWILKFRDSEGNVVNAKQAPPIVPGVHS